VLVGFGQTQAPLGLGSDATLAALVHGLAPDAAAAVEDLVALVRSFATTHVQTVAILPVLQ